MISLNQMRAWIGNAVNVGSITMKTLDMNACCVFILCAVNVWFAPKRANKCDSHRRVMGWKSRLKDRRLFISPNHWHYSLGDTNLASCLDRRHDRQGFEQLDMGQVSASIVHEMLIPLCSKWIHEQHGK